MVQVCMPCSRAAVNSVHAVNSMTLSFLAAARPLQGNIEPLFAIQAPNCWSCKEGTECSCNQTTVDNVQVGRGWSMMDGQNPRGV